MDFLSEYGIKFKNKDLLKTALTHSSKANEERSKSYERLEFLGDAVLELITSEYFYTHYKLREGDMSKIRSSFVCENALFEYSKKIGLIDHIRTGNGVSKETVSIVADCFESILAVIFLEHGFYVAKKFALAIIVPYIESNHGFIHDSKSYLQEVAQTSQKSIAYQVINETGPSHDKTFEVQVLIDNLVYGTGSGKTKKEAEQNAASDAIKKIAER